MPFWKRDWQIETNISTEGMLRPDLLAAARGSSRWPIARTLLLLVASEAAALSGCKALTKKHDNPVMIPPPRRVTLDDSQVDEQLAKRAASPIKQTAASDTEDDTEVFNARVVARVNGAPVFAGEVLERYGEYLGKAREKLSPEEYRELRDAIIRRDLRSHIERRLLVERMKSNLKPDQIKQLQAHVDRQFESTRIPKLKSDLKVNTRTELELALNERDTTLDAVRDSFATEQMAMEYLFSKIERPPAPTRPEIVAYYHEHTAEFTVPARVKWQQIQVSADRRTSKTDARGKIQKAQQELQGGASFESVAKKYSDGPTAGDGGNWDWIRSGSLADSDLEKKLFQDPVGKVSGIYEGKGAFHIIRVVAREDQSVRLLADVQDEIEQKLTQDRQKDLPKQFIDQLFKDAVIETDYDYLSPIASK